MVKIKWLQLEIQLLKGVEEMLEAKRAREISELIGETLIKIEEEIRHKALAGKTEAVVGIPTVAGIYILIHNELTRVGYGVSTRAGSTPRCITINW